MNRIKQWILEKLGKMNMEIVTIVGLSCSLGVTTLAVNSVGMGIVTFIMVSLAAVIIALAQKWITKRIVIWCYTVLIFAFTGIASMILYGFVRPVGEGFGFCMVTLIINGMLLGRLSDYGYGKSVKEVLAGCGKYAGKYAVFISLIGILREFLAPIAIAKLAPGAFFVTAGLTALYGYLEKETGERYLKIAKGFMVAGLITMAVFGLRSFL